MSSINPPSSLRFGPVAMLALLLLASGSVCRGVRSTAKAGAFDHYYDGTNFDLNDELSRMTHLRAAHRQEVVETETTTEVTAPTLAGVVKNDDLLPTSLFVTPPILLNETHPKSESEGYLQVLQAMKYTPVVVSTAASTRDIQAKAGLNNALLKILTTTKQITSSARSSVTSSSVTINQILQNYASLVFGRTYTEFNGSAPVVPVVQGEVVVPFGNTTIVNYANGTSVELPGDYNVDLNGAIVPSPEVQTEAPIETAEVQTEDEPAKSAPASEATTEVEAQALSQAEEQALAQLEAEAATDAATQPAPEVEEAVQEAQAIPEPIIEAQSEAQAQEDIPKRLLSLMQMYAEHVEYKDKDIIADDKHYGHLKNMDSHLHCLSDDQCDFTKHLLGGTRKRSRHLLESYIANKKDVQSAHAAEFQGQVLSLIKSLPGLASNEDIRKTTGDWIAKNQKFLNDFQGVWPDVNQAIQGEISNFKSNLPIYQNLTPDQFLAVLDHLGKTYKAKIDEEFTANGISEKANELIEMKAGVEALHQGLRKVIPANGVLESDFTELEQKLARHIAVFQRASNASPEQLEAARIKLKNNLQMQLNGIDPVVNSELVRNIANDADAILASDFGKSLNQDNLNFIVQKSLNAFRVDLDQLKDNKKASGFILDQTDLQRLADDVVDELKKSREGNQKIVLDLRDFNKYIQAQNRLFSANDPHSANPADDAAELLISYENYFYDALSSDEFHNSLKDYIARYYDVYYAHVDPLQPFFNYSAAYKTLTAGLDNPNALGNLNPQAVRLLKASGELQVAHLAHLSDTDKQFFHLLDHLTAEWALTTNHVAFDAKLGDLIQAIQGKVSSFQPAHLLHFSEEHMLLEIFTNVKNAIVGVINNLGTSATAANGLVNTITHGQQLVKSAADQYQVGDLLTNNSTSTGVIGGLKNTVKGWFGFRNLEVHYGLTETLTSVRNLWSSISEAKDTADKLKTSLNQAQGLANNVRDGVNLFNSVAGASA